MLQVADDEIVSWTARSRIRIVSRSEQISAIQGQRSVLV